MKTLTWRQVKWPYNSDAPYRDWECHRYGKVILHPGQWPNEGWSYVASFGPNDDRSHSGFLPGLVDLGAAKAEIEARYVNLARR